MPRAMPRFDKDFSLEVQNSLDIVRAGELTRITGDPKLQAEWTIPRLEALYELAYMRMFASWEMYLQAILCRSLCGYASASGQEQVLARPTFYRNLAAAETALLQGRQYLLWHDPTKVAALCRQMICSGTPGVQEAVLVANTVSIQSLAWTRHRIVHSHQKDAKNKFDAATHNIAGRLYPASRPGRFLRDRHPTRSPRQRWIEILGGDLVAFVRQMC